MRALKRTGAVLGAALILLLLLAPQLVGLIYIAGGIVGGTAGAAARRFLPVRRPGAVPYLGAGLGALITGVGVAIAADVSDPWLAVAISVGGAVLVPVAGALLVFGITGNRPGLSEPGDQ